MHKPRNNSHSYIKRDMEKNVRLLQSKIMYMYLLDRNVFLIMILDRL